MEEKIRMTNDRVRSLEDRLNKVEEQVDSNYDKIHEFDEKHTQRYLETTVLVTTLKETSKAIENNTKVLADSMNSFVEEMKNSNDTTNKEFGKVHEDISDIKNQLKTNSEAVNIKLEEKKLSNKIIVTIIGSAVAFFELFSKIIVPFITGG